MGKNNQKEFNSGLVLPAGESRILKLSGKTAQLGNKGGAIRLVNASGDQVHAVSYSKEGATEQGRYIRFSM